MDSLKKLKTDYIDILYVHWWDWNTSIPEVMDGLHSLVMSGKVLYLVGVFSFHCHLCVLVRVLLSTCKTQGASDCPAWIVATANQYAKDHGKSPFVIYQGAWNVMDRSFERDIIPMARAHGKKQT